MSWLYRALVRPLLFMQDSESVHERTMKGLAWIAQRRLAGDAAVSFFGGLELPVHAFGLAFPNPVGLAAGMDKYGVALPAWETLGFGFTELGGVTWQPQLGNPSPRLFRVVPEEALINRMGFNNAGAEALARKLEEWRMAGLWPTHPVGVNLGKSKITPLEKAAEDYAQSCRVLWQHADFFVVNVSSPNTPNLRQLQDKGPLDEILAALQQVNGELSAGVGTARPCQDGEKLSGVGASRPGSGVADHTDDTAGSARYRHFPKPILVKVAPDLTFTALDEMLELVVPRNVAGIVATNTTITRPETKDPALATRYSEVGGLSGKPLRERSTEVVRHVYQQTNGSLPIIGVGGIFNAADAWEKIKAGASLVQIYTGLVYEGPGLIREILEGLSELMSAEGFTQLSQAVGVAHKAPN